MAAVVPVVPFIKIQDFITRTAGTIIIVISLFYILELLSKMKKLMKVKQNQYRSSCFDKADNFPTVDFGTAQNLHQLGLAHRIKDAAAR